MKIRLTIREIVEIAMLVAFAIILGLPGLKITVGNNGGSISFVMIPLIVLALRVGFIKGFIGIGIVYGAIQCLIAGHGLISFPFDYLLGYGCLAIVGLFKNTILMNKSKIISILLVVVISFFACILRLLFSTISGIVFYEIDFVGSLIYNAAYILPDSAITIFGLALLIRPLVYINRRFPIKKH